MTHTRGYSVNWRKEKPRGVNVCPVAVRKQKGGSCGVYSSVSCQESLNRIQRTRPSSSHVEVHEARSMVLSPKYAVAKMIHDAGGMKNAKFGALRAVEFLKTTGTIRSQHYEDSEKTPRICACSGLEHFKLVSWKCLKGKDRIKEAEKALEDGPIIGCFYTTDDFYILGRGEVYTASGARRVRKLSDGRLKYRRHAVCITGYSGRGEKGLLDFLNSWGERWGDSGFGRMKKTVIDRFFVPVVPA